MERGGGRWDPCWDRIVHLPLPESGKSVFDPLYGANSAESLSDGRSARNALQGLKDLCNEEGCTAVVIHHLTKNVGAGLVRERMADSNQILATASMDILMDSKDERDGGRLITLKCRGRGSFANQNWVVRSRSVTEFELVAHGEGVSAGEVSADSPRQIILRKLAEGPRDAESLASDAGIPYSSTRTYIGQLVREGLIEVGDRVNARKQYRLTQDEVATCNSLGNMELQQGQLSLDLLQRLEP